MAQLGLHASSTILGAAFTIPRRCLELQKLAAFIARQAQHHDDVLSLAGKPRRLAPQPGRAGPMVPRCCYLTGSGADTRSMAADSSSLSSSVRAAEFSRMCSGLVAPGIGIT